MECGVLVTESGFSRALMDVDEDRQAPVRFRDEKRADC